MANWLNLGEMVKLNAKKYPNAVCLMDKDRSFTFPQTNERACRLADALAAMGLQKGDSISVLLENCTEFVEIYLAAAKGGFVVNPINFRLTPQEIGFIAKHAESRAFIVHDELCPMVDSIRKELGIKRGRYVVVGQPRDGYLPYENFLLAGEPSEPKVALAPSDPWILLYTSGTTGTPKGVLRSHESYISFYLINAVDFDFRPFDRVLNVMPLCHVNSTFFTFTLTYIGGSAYIHPARKFDPRDIFAIVERAKISFISLIPTHYALLLSVPPEERAKHDVSSIRKLLCSSAPARVEQKKAIMECFKGVQLYEGYGSTEAGIVTTLFPDEQLTKPGSIGRESVGTDQVKILDETKCPVFRGQIGELYSRGPMMFDEYYKEPEKTAASFAGEWFSAGDMAYQDDEGYYFLVDRKNNMIITGGEHVYPSEVEAVLCSHDSVLDAAVIGVHDPKWGEAVKAIVILKEGAACAEAELLALCRDRLAGYKRPKSVDFIAADDMPRTASGKILHRVLRERYAPKV